MSKRSFRALLENMIVGEAILIHDDQFSSIRIRRNNKKYEVLYKESYVDDITNKVKITKESYEYETIFQVIEFINKYYTLCQINLQWVSV